MTLIKSQITDAIAKQNGFTRIKSTETIETILEIIKSTLASGGEVLIRGFGKVRLFYTWVFSKILSFQANA